MLSKVCIFCGNPPSGKNKEHVIPQWLIRATGKPCNDVVRSLFRTQDSQLRTDCGSGYASRWNGIEQMAAIHADGDHVHRHKPGAGNLRSYSTSLSVVQEFDLATCRRNLVLELAHGQIIPVV